MTDLIGRDIGRYHIVEHLGQGGMAVVYKAYDTRLERDVAVKFIRVEMIAAAYQADMLKRFEREAKSLARLSHPNILKVLDFGEYEGVPYLVMEYLSGGTLKDRTGHPMPYPQGERKGLAKLGKWIGGGIFLLLLLVSGCSGWAGGGVSSTPTLLPPETAAARPTGSEESNQSPTITKVFTQIPTQSPSTTVVVPTLNPSPGIGSSQISEKDGMKLLYVPAGKFQMGSTGEQFQANVTQCVKDGNKLSDCENWYLPETPVHTVTMHAFWIDQTEVTNAMYQKCVDAGSCQPSKYKDNADFNGAQQPAVGVNWGQASAYCAWAGRRLPTEAEWEKAARGTDGRAYPWGNRPPDKTLLNYKGNIGKTTDVGSYPTGASPNGALDMAGNVWEWVSDWFSAYYYHNSPDRNPVGPDSGGTRVLRGGSWFKFDDDPRSAYRGTSYPPDQDPGIGFRCAVTQP